MSRPFLFNAFIYAQAGIMLDSIPAPGANFSYSIHQKREQKIEQTPEPSPNPSPFIFSINFIYYSSNLILKNKILIKLLIDKCLKIIKVLY